MSETTEQPGGPAPEPVDAPAPADAPIPDSGSDSESEPEEKQETAPRGDRRFAAITAKLAAAERVQAQQMAELDYYRRQFQQQSPQPEQQISPEVQAQISAAAEAKVRADYFHDRGRAEHPDWEQKCSELVKMGADPGFAQLLVKMPGGEGVRVAAALADDPEQVQRIARMPDAETRAVALGKYAATLDADFSQRTAVPQRVQPVTRAPAPVRAVTGRAAPVFNEYSASGQALVDHYMRQNLERQQGR